MGRRMTAVLPYVREPEPYAIPRVGPVNDVVPGNIAELQRRMTRLELALLKHGLLFEEEIK